MVNLLWYMIDSCAGQHQTLDLGASQLDVTRPAVPELSLQPTAECRDSCFSLNTSHRMAYSGVATYWRLEAVAPVAAEDGLAGKLQGHVPLATGEPQAERASGV